MIPDDTHPALAAFYMFWTMIIVLQVSDSERKHLISTQTHVTTGQKVGISSLLFTKAVFI